MTALQSEILELKANSSRAAKGVIIEGRLDRGRGPVATALIQNGSLREGDAVRGRLVLRTRPLADRSRRQEGQGRRPLRPGRDPGTLWRAGGGRPYSWPSRTSARPGRSRRCDSTGEAKGKTTTRITLEGLQKQIQTGEVKELRLILKGDVQGSVEALANPSSGSRPTK